MATFAFIGQGPQGRTQGELDGETAQAVAGLLRARGITPIRIQPQGSAAAAAMAPARAQAAAREGRANEAHRGSDLLRAITARQRRVTPQDLMMFARQMHTLLRSGVPILRALAGLQESSVNQTMRRTLGEVRRSLESGIDLSKCLAQHPKVFDAFFVSMVRVGEQTGQLDEVFRRLNDHIEFETSMRQQVATALRYPMFVVIAMAVAIGVINVLVIPAFAKVFEAFGAELPLATRILLATSRFTLQWGWLVCAALVVAFLAFRHWKQTPAGQLAWSAIVLKMPLAGPIVRKGALSRFARSFSLALKSGLPLEQAMALVAQTADNALIASKVDGMREQVERGDTILRSAISAGIFTPVVLQMIAVGEETGAVDELLGEVATLYTNEVQYELKTLAQRIEPILIMFMGAMVLVLALGVFLPMWDLGKVAMKR